MVNTNLIYKSINNYIFMKLLLNLLFIIIFLSYYYFLVCSYIYNSTEDSYSGQAIETILE